LNTGCIAGWHDPTSGLYWLLALVGVHSLIGHPVLVEEHDQVKCSARRTRPPWSLLYR
jgi:hypothetical protein